MKPPKRPRSRQWSMNVNSDERPRGGAQRDCAAAAFVIGLWGQTAEGWICEPWFAQGTFLHLSSVFASEAIALDETTAKLESLLEDVEKQTETNRWQHPVVSVWKGKGMRNVSWNHQNIFKKLYLIMMKCCHYLSKNQKTLLLRFPVEYSCSETCHSMFRIFLWIWRSLWR